LKLFNDDCLKVLKQFDEESVDLVVTDCPYRITSGGCTAETNVGGIINHALPLAKQGKLFSHNEIKFSEWLPEIYRVLKNNAHCYIMINARNLKELQQCAEDSGFIFQNLLIWDKGNATPNKFYMNACEFILMLRKGKAKYINNMGSKNILRVPNIIGNKQHPTEKPAELMQILIENSSNKGDIVLDPFMGVGGGRSCL
jgi:site-specific DNA-methyltransferase (adenine-specific)